MHFTLEALQAHQGDSLLIHWGTPDRPRLMLVDGGPDPTYRATLQGRLDKLTATRRSKTLDLDLVMISHIDDDHIQGIQRLLTAIARDRPPPIQINTVWFNSFEDLVAIESGFVAARQAKTPKSDRLQRLRTSAIIASVPQGRAVANLVRQLGLSGNGAFAGLVVAATKPSTATRFGDLQISVLGPSRHRVDELQRLWAATKTDGSSLAFLDESVANLSSIVVLVQFASKSMLLTGDARGDDILEGAQMAGLITRRKGLHVDLLKVPHHGSDRNVDTDFFRRITANHYVISGDGHDANPELATLEMLTEARRGAAFDIHFTNREPRLERWFKRNRDDRDRYRVHYRRSNRSSIKVHLRDPLT